MKLSIINENCLTEDLAAKLSEKVKQILRTSLGEVVRDTDAVVHYALRGISSHRDKLIIQDEEWWAGLFDLLEPIDQNQLEQLFEKTSKWVKDLVERGAKGEQVFEEGVLSGIASLFKALGKLVMAAIEKMIDAMAERDGVAGGGGAGGIRGYDKQKLKMKLLTRLNCEAVGNFLESVSEAAKTSLKQRRKRI